jgi:glycosyltransferase involved in cell wall biosynthesis
MKTLENVPLISVVLPVYNRPEYLGKAIESVLNQTHQNFEFIIADDNSQKPTKDFLKNYSSNSKVKIISNSKNLGLFPNLSNALKLCQGDYILFLCSDDFLLPDCLETSLNFAYNYPEANLVLCPTKIVDYNNQYLTPPHHFFYNQLKLNTRVWFPEESVPLLLRYGSINGNLTGMFFKRELYEKIGGFKDIWSHAADWEWLYRASKFGPILITTTHTSVIRHHSEQLSGVNFRNTSNSLEVIEMVRILLADPHVQKVEAARQWALNLLQLHFWFALKFAFQGRWSEAMKITKAINQVTGIGSTFWAMLRWLPQRWKIYRQKSVLVQPE